VDQLAIGMILRQNLENKAGLLVVAKGQEVTEPLIIKLKNLYNKGLVQASVKVGVPQEIGASATAGK
jgi:hypothetical protein